MSRSTALRAALFVVLAVAVSVPALAWERPTSGSPFHPGGPAPHRGLFLDGTGAWPDASPRFHDGVNLVCADCHVMHASRSHASGPAGPRPGEEVPYLAAPNALLLTAPDPLDLCLSCHDGHTFAPDVVGADANGLAQRSAGFFDQPEVINPRGHDLGRGLPPAPDEFCFRCHFGDGTQKKVTCIDCHNPHGNGVARNLQWASYPEGTPDLGLFVNPGATGMARYEAANVSYGTLDNATLREINNMCIDCHHVFSGGNYTDLNHNGIHERHPVYDSERGAPNNIAMGLIDGTTAPAHWESGTGSGFNGTPRLRWIVSGASDYTAGTVVDAETNGVFCLSCHYAHGSENAFGMLWAPNSGVGGDGCDQCHLKAVVPSP